MRIVYCDKCGKQLNTYRFHITYSGNNEVELCEECATEFKAWVNGDSLADKIQYLTESRDWWKDQCKEFYEDFKTVETKLSKTYNALLRLIDNAKENDAE